jgi:hypothetical protein
LNHTCLHTSCVGADRPVAVAYMVAAENGSIQGSSTTVQAQSSFWKHANPLLAAAKGRRVTFVSSRKHCALLRALRPAYGTRSSEPVAGAKSRVTGAHSQGHLSRTAREKKRGGTRLHNNIRASNAVRPVREVAAGCGGQGQGRKRGEAERAGAG